MSNVIIARKVGMTRAFTDKGAIVLTVLQADPNTVLSVKTDKKDGYSAVQVGAGKRKAKHINKPLTGQMKPSGATPSEIFEFRMDDVDAKAGDIIDISKFAENDVVTVSGITKGKGYAGNIKRHGFHRGPTTHGSDHHRAPGSIGSAYPQRVFKGKKMAGHLGNVKSVCTSKVFGTITNENILLLNGSLPGPKGMWLKVQSK